MTVIRKILLGLVALGLLVLAVTTWGSVGSGVCIYGLIMMVAALLYKRFLVNRDNDAFDPE